MADICFTVSYVSPTGDNSNDGSLGSPVSTIDKALAIAKESNKTETVINLMQGEYELTNPITINSQDFADKYLTIKAHNNEKVIVKGSKKVALEWKKGKNNIYTANIDADFDQLYINGQQRILARYPNYVAGEILNGYSEDAISTSRIKKWKNPQGGFIHALHNGQWGGMHYVITGKNKNEITYEGGHQNNRPSKMHDKYRFVENIREELEDKSEWFYDKAKKQLLYIPLDGEDLDNATIEIVTTPSLINIVGTDTNPARNIAIKDIKFQHTSHTFMSSYEKLMRSDWQIHRGAALFIENAEDCTITNCEFAELGGNAIFISKYGFNHKIVANHIYNIGASAISLVGSTDAVRSGSMEYSEYVPYEEMDKTPGPANHRYPRQCIVEDNLIHDIGLVEKQVAGVQIQIAAQLNVAHNSIYRVPRSGINIGDGAFGGHIIEYNDVFDTVLETSDHGAFNSWGRDRFWHPNRRVMDELTSDYPELILLDALYTTTIQNNRFQCAHGWDIDLDDGSSNYHIYSNLCLQGGIKLREGFERKVENNIMINNSFHPHVWFANSGDVFQRNIVTRPYYPIQVQHWGRLVNYNLFASDEDLHKQQESGTDANSISHRIDYNDYTSGDYTITNSDAISKIGFENFPMNRFGVYSPHLKEKAEVPQFPRPVIISSQNSTSEEEWLGATIKSVSGMGDQSAHGLPTPTGVIIVNISTESILNNLDINQGDVIRSAGGSEVKNIGDLLRLTEENRWKGYMTISFYRNQTEREISISFR